MVFDVNSITKRVQYITVDSEFVSGSNNVFSVNFGTSSYSISNTDSNGVISTTGYRTTGSNIFVQEMRNVIGLKLVDFYVTQVGTFEVGINIGGYSVTLTSFITSGGSGFAIGDTIQFTPSPTLPGGITATATVLTISGGAVTSIQLLNPGSGYTVAPTAATKLISAGGSGTVTVSGTSLTAITTNSTSQFAVKYIDILCPDLPDTAQILDERKSKIFARIPLERDFSGSSNTIVNDKQWKNFDRQTNYFNPISITKLNFQMWELTGNPSIGPGNFGTYQTLQPDAQFYMILEVTTIDNSIITLPKEDPQIKVVHAIEALEKRFASLFEDLPNMIKAGIPEPVVQEPVVVSIPIVPSTIAHTDIPDEKPPVADPVVDMKKMDTKMYIIIALVILFIAYIFSSKK